MSTKSKVQKVSPEVTPTPASTAAADSGFSLTDMRTAAETLLSLAHKYKVDMSLRHWTVSMTDGVSQDFQAFNDARTAYLTERDLRKDSTAAFKGEVQADKTFREGLIASLRFIGQTEPKLLDDARLSGGVKSARSVARWINEAVSLVTKYEQELIACGFSPAPVAAINERVSALGQAISTQEQNQQDLPALRTSELAARTKLLASMERLRHAGLMTFAGNKAVLREFRKNVKPRRKAKKVTASPAEVAAPAPATESAAKPAGSPATDAAKPAS